MARSYIIVIIKSIRGTQIPRLINTTKHVK